MNIKRFLFRGTKTREEVIVNEESDQDDLDSDRESTADKHSDREEADREAVDMDPENIARTYELMHIFEFFPDVQTEYALGLLDQENNDVKEVLDRLVETDGTYPKDDPPPPPPKEDNTEATDEGESDGTKKIEINFMSSSSFVPSSTYKQQCIELLPFHFPFLDYCKAKSVFKTSSCHYAIAHNTICQTIMGKADTPELLNNGRKFDELLLAVLTDKASLEKDELDLLSDLFKPDAKRSISLALMTFFKPKSPRITDPILQEEVQYVHERTLELKNTIEQGIAKRRARQASILMGNAVECSCCYEDVAMDELVACREEGHLFCSSCLSTYVETQLFGQGGMGVDPETKEAATEIMCCHGDGCSSGFDRRFLEKALSANVLKKYDEMSYQVTVEKAGLQEKMYSCPKCELMFELPEGANFFVCPIEGCDYEACRHCGEPPHAGRLCSEVERASETKGRVRVEEAATAAVIRKCPACHKAVLKSDGCNKMTCNCAARQKWCYVCTKKVLGYNHFCQEPHCDHRDPPRTCRGRCPLYTDAEADDKLRAREAALTEAAKVESEAIPPEVQRKSAWGPTRTREPANVLVDIDSILHIPR